MSSTFVIASAVVGRNEFCKKDDSPKILPLSMISKVTSSPVGFMTYIRTLPLVIK